MDNDDYLNECDGEVDPVTEMQERIDQLEELDQYPNEDEDKGDPMTPEEVNKLRQFIMNEFIAGSTNIEIARELEAYTANREHLIAVIRLIVLGE